MDYKGKLPTNIELSYQYSTFFDDDVEDMVKDWSVILDSWDGDGFVKAHEYIDWCSDNCKHDFHYNLGQKKDSSNLIHLMFFKNKKDAMIFKLAH